MLFLRPHLFLVIMIKHVVMWKLKESAAGADKATNAASLKQKLEGLKVLIPQIRHLEVGINFAAGDAAWDVVLITEFGSKEDLAIYINHPDHQSLVGFVSEIRTERAVVDAEI
jgi:hypothetical protein